MRGNDITLHKPQKPPAARAHQRTGIYTRTIKKLGEAGWDPAVAPPPISKTATLMKLWMNEDAVDSTQAMNEAEKRLREFKRDMNKARKESGSSLCYPDV